MSTPRYTWWSYAKGIIRSYPELRDEEEDLHRQKMTASYDGMPKGQGDGRSLEHVALRELPACKQRELDAVRSVIEQTKKLSSGAERMKMINLVYWRQSHTLSGAAYKLHVHPQTAKNWHREFVCAVGDAMGFRDGMK